MIPACLCPIGFLQEGGGVRYFSDLERYGLEENAHEDRHGHGTAVASLLAAFCPEAIIVPVRIAQVQGGHSTYFVSEKILAQAIDWCINKKIRLINVSYSIEGVQNNGLLAKVCRRAAENHTIIIAAYRNGFQKPVYPAAFPFVIGVSIRADIEYAQIAMTSENNHDVVASGGPYQTISPDNKPRIVFGTSFATAQVSGMVARMLVVRPTLTFNQVFGYLKKYSTE